MSGTSSSLNVPARRPVCRAIHQPKAWWGIQQSVVFGGLYAGLLGMAVIGLVVGVLIGVGILVVGYLALAYDPQLAWMIWHAGRLRPRYDPLKHEPVTIVIEG